METIYKPLRYFMLTFVFAWIPGFISAYLSYQEGMQDIQQLAMYLVIFAPFLAAVIMLSGSKNKTLRKDFWSRFQWRRLRLSFLPAIFLLVPLVIFLATLISLLFGYSAKQFTLANQAQILHGQAFASLLILFLAPVFEELGWRGYGVDSLRSRFNLFNTSVLFGVFWGLYHLPLFFIKGYYHHELWETNMIYVVNFVVSILTTAFIINWIYYKNHRSIVAAILFHFIIDLFSVNLQTEQFTKCIITLLLIIFAAVVVMMNKNFFFSRQKNWFNS